MLVGYETLIVIDSVNDTRNAKVVHITCIEKGFCMKHDKGRYSIAQCIGKLYI